MSKSLEKYLQYHQKPELKLALFDVDGTLLNIDGNYTARVQNSIARVQSLGVKTAVASGRPFFATQFLWEELGLIDAGVFCTGAQVFEPRTNTLHKTHTLPQPTVAALLKTLRANSYYYELYTDTGLYIERDIAPEILAVHSAHLRAKASLQNFDDVTAPVVKLLVGVDVDVDGDALQVMEREFPGCIFAYARLPAYSRWLFVSIIDRAASKRTAFDFLLTHYDITPENVISFGDAQSDMAFITMAGVGVAMGNASDEVKNVADIVTAPVWDDGVAEVLDVLI